MTPQQLFQQNIKLAYKLASRHYSNHLTSEDIKQHALIGLWAACCTFDETKGIKLSTYAWTCIKNELTVALRGGKLVEGAQKNGRYKDAASIYCDETGVIDSCIGSHEDRVCAKVDADRLLQKIPPYEADVLMGSIGNERTLAEIAADKGCTPEAVRARVGVAYRNALIVASGEVVDLRSGHDRKKEHLETCRGLAAAKREARLRERLLQIAELRMNGFDNKEICKRLRLSPYRAKALLNAAAPV
jgi:RNA polymerase sigma factor (sigma-70 family)